MNRANIVFLSLGVSLLPIQAALGCCGLCTPEELAAYEARQKKRDEALAYQLAEQERIAAIRRQQAAIVEQQRLLTEANNRKRQEERDAYLAQQIAQQELDAERRRAAAVQQQLLDEANRRKRQEERDAYLAQQIAQQELAAERRRATAAQQQLLDDANRRKRQEQQDAALAAQIAQQELFALEQQKNRERQRQINADAALALQLQAEELLQINSPLTTTLPQTPTQASLVSWTRSNNTKPTSVSVDDVLCSVCLSTPEDLAGQQLIKFSCSHVFCKSCTKQLLSSNSNSLSCPNCRTAQTVSTIKSALN